MINGAEWYIVIGAIILIFGSSQIPKLARNLGRAQKEFKDGIAQGQRDGEEAAAKSKSDSGSDS